MKNNIYFIEAKDISDSSPLLSLSLIFFFLLSSLLPTSAFVLHILWCRWWVIVVIAMQLIDEGELSCGLQETLEDTEGIIHPSGLRQKPESHCMIWV